MLDDCREALIMNQNIQNKTLILQRKDFMSCCKISISKVLNQNNH